VKIPYETLALVAVRIDAYLAVSSKIEAGYQF
jgi:hypothetical protein